MSSGSHRACEVEIRTPAEVSDYQRTPNYAETLKFLEQLSVHHPDRVRIEDFGRSGEGRALKVAICSADGTFDPSAIHASGKVVLLVQNAIHAGEMDGKDACLALLRDLLYDPSLAPLLERVVLVIIPIYNVDGHERRSAYNRFNQNGPEEMGWRANATNLNLNRDYLKADAPETRAFLRLFRKWAPDFFVDNHVTDGADFQYEATFGIDATPDVFPETAAWIRSTVTPQLDREVNAEGHLVWPDLVILVDDTDPAKGLEFISNAPRFSTGYMILRNRPGLLVELHALKSYRRRVSADYAILRSLLGVLNREARHLIELNQRADAAAEALGSVEGRGAPFPLVVSWSGETTEVMFRGVEFERFASPVSGQTAIRYSEKPMVARLPSRTGASVSVQTLPPAGYIVPPGWVAVVDVLEAHGVTVRRLTRPWTGTVERYHCSGMRWPSQPFEGRHPILATGNVESAMGEFGRCELSKEEGSFPAQSVVVPLDQTLAKIAIHWLEPEAPDSALRWGFFDSIFEQKETGEAYEVERLAARDLTRDTVLRTEFERRIAADATFAADPQGRLDFFYRQTPWWPANRVGAYPVARLPTLQGLPTPRD